MHKAARSGSVSFSLYLVMLIDTLKKEMGMILKHICTLCWPYSNILHQNFEERSILHCGRGGLDAGQTATERLNTSHFLHVNQCFLSVRKQVIYLLQKSFTLFKTIRKNSLEGLCKLLLLIPNFYVRIEARMRKKNSSRSAKASDKGQMPKLFSINKDH